MASEDYAPHRLSLAGVLIAIGITTGNIGTSPLYVFNAIAGHQAITYDLVVGSLSCIFWTLLIITTFKYVVLALLAEREGEGGIFVLYGLVRHAPYRWPVIAALIGCSTLMADGFITPPISVSAAVEGLDVLYPGVPTLPITLTLIVGLFAFQQVGTSVLGRAFGPVMVLWFGLLAYAGVQQLRMEPGVLAAVNPYHALHFLAHYPNGFWLLGGVFLCTTGAEALYADLGHCGRANIRTGWLLVLPCLLLNYFGQGALLLRHGGTLANNQSVFYALFPESWLPFVILLATVAAIIASQALLSGCFTLVNEAMRLRLWIPLKVTYPAHSKGQLYINAINWFLFLGCLLVIFIFQESSAMEAAYGLTIAIDMLMTTALLLLLFRMRRVSPALLVPLGIVLFAAEGLFFLSNTRKFLYGGWFPFMVAMVLFILLYLFQRARSLRDHRFRLANLEDYIPMFEALINDDTIEPDADNLVFMAKKSTRGTNVDSNIIYSIFQQQPKRAHTYWFVHVDILDFPHERESNYRVKTIIPGKVFFVRLEFGFKVKHNVHRLFKKVVEEMAKNNEVDLLSHRPSMRHFGVPANFRYVFVKSMVSADNDLAPINKIAMATYNMLHLISYPPYKDFGLDTMNVTMETTPIHFHLEVEPGLVRKDFGPD